MIKPANTSPNRLVTCILRTRIPTELYDKVLLICRAQGASRKTVVTQLLKRGLETRAKELDGELQEQLTRI